MRKHVLWGVSSLFLSAFGAKAIIPFEELYGVSKHFKNLAQSPMNAVLAKGGLIENLRFYGAVTPAWDDSNRMFVKDTPLNPLGHVLQILFPSPAGTLNTHTNAISNFGKHVSQPETVALLLNFVGEVRQNLNQTETSPEKIRAAYKEKILKTLNTEDGAAKKKSGRSTQKLLTKLEEDFSDAQP